MSWEVADKYVVFDVWIDVTEAGEDVVIELQGVRADGSYWVNGFQVRMPRGQFEATTADGLVKYLSQQVESHEAELENWRKRQTESLEKTDALRKTEKYKLKGRTVWERPK